MFCERQNICNKITAETFENVMLKIIHLISNRLHPLLASKLCIIHLASPSQGSLKSQTHTAEIRRDVS